MSGPPEIGHIVGEWIARPERIRAGAAVFMGVTLCRMKDVEAVPAGRITVLPEVIADYCRRHHIHKLSLFGSVLRDDFRPESDVDVLVEFEPGATPGLFEYVGMEMELTELLGRKVDLLTAGFLSPYFREEVLREARPIHVAA